MDIVKNEPRELVLHDKIIAPYYVAGVFLFLAILIFLVTWLSQLADLSINLGFGFSFLIIGSITMFFGGEKTYAFNKNSQMLLVTIKNRIRTKENEYMLPEIDFIFEEVFSQSNSMNYPKLVIYYSLILKNNSKIRLSFVRQHASYQGFKINKETNIPLFVQAIALFLDIPITTKYNFKNIDEILS